MARALRWILPFWLAYTIVWIVWWGYRLTSGGGLDSSAEAISMVISGIGCVVGLSLGWQVRRAR